MKVVSIVGARPQFVKAAVVSRALHAAGIAEIIVHTGQHYDGNMSDIFFDELDIPRPAIHLGVGSGPHGAQTGRMLSGIESIIVEERPDWLLVYGDTNSTLAGALAAAKLHVPVAHVEAGLRSFNRRMPEEVNRVLTDHVSDLLFAPTQSAVENLSVEGIAGARVQLVGDVMKDAVLYYANRSGASGMRLEELGLRTRGYLLATVHRAENTADPDRLAAIMKGLVAASSTTTVVLPLHPRTRAALEDTDLLREVAHHCRVLDPVGYLDMLVLEKGAALIVTDSGGVQKEAFFFQVPCITVRDETEWVELVELGWNRLVPPTSATAVAEAIAEQYGEQGFDSALFGNGHASTDIARLLAEHRAAQ